MHFVREQGQLLPRGRPPPSAHRSRRSPRLSAQHRPRQRLAARCRQSGGVRAWKAQAAVWLLDARFLQPRAGELRGAPGLRSGLRGFWRRERVVGTAGPLPEPPATEATSTPGTVPPTSGERWAQSPGPRGLTDEALEGGDGRGSPRNASTAGFMDTLRPQTLPRRAGGGGGGQLEAGAGARGRSQAASHLLRPQAFPRLLLGPLKTRSCCSRRWSELLRAGNAASRAFRLPAQAPEGRLASFLPEASPVRVGVGVRVRGRQLKAEVGRVPSPVLPLPHLNPQVRLSQPLLSGSHIL